MTEKSPLQYEISDWSQIGRCLSNNSQQLYVCLSQFIQNTGFKGKVIKVQHTLYGTLFAAAVAAEGEIVSNIDLDGNPIPYMTVDEILTQLKRFGFYIRYRQYDSLPGVQLSYLSSLVQLDYDKLTQVRVAQKDGSIRTRIIAFKSNSIVDQFAFGCTIPSVLYTSYLEQGYVLALPDDRVADLDWSWLEYTCNIQDVLTENSTVRGVDFDLNGVPDEVEAESNEPLFVPVDETKGESTSEDTSSQTPEEG